MKWGCAALVLVTIVACACPRKGGGGGGGSAQGSGSGVTDPPAGGCEGLRTKIEGLYRAEAQAKEPKRVEEAVADNTAMAMAECTKAPDTVAPCIARVSTVKELEASCMPQLDDEGSEGDALKPR